MRPIAPKLPDRRPRACPLVRLLAGMALLLAGPGAAAAQPVAGAWIEVPCPITSEVVSRIKTETDRAIRAQRARVIIYHFQTGDVSSFGSCSELADFILKDIQGQAETYAWVDRPLRGHAVLPALACQFLWMGPEGGIGEVGYRRAAQLGRPEQLKYAEVAKSRGRPEAIVLKMLDKNLVVYQVESPVRGKQYKLEGDLTAEDRNSNPKILKPAGEEGYYPTDQALAVGLCGGRYDSPQQIAEVLGLPGSVIQGNPMLALVPQAALIEIKGEIDRGAAETARRKIERALEKEKANCLIFQMETCYGGLKSARTAHDLARFIKEKTAGQALTIAYLPGGSRVTGSAVFVALGCNHIVMGSGAELGDCKALVREGGTAFDPAEIGPVRESLVKLAAEQGYSPVLFEAMLDPALEIVHVEAKPDPARGGQPWRTYKKKADYEQEKDKWTLVQGPPIKRADGQFLRLDADRAYELGVARHRVNSPGVKGLAALYGLEPDRIVTLGSVWLDELVNVLTHPVTTVFLVILGFTCLILEFKAPGVGLPAIVAAVCFVLIFWSHSWLAREVNSLAILLFLLGLILLGVELFILPGFGVMGISGILLLLLSLALLVVREWPQSQEGYVELGKNVGIFGAGLVASLFAAYALARHLPSIPYANKMVLAPPDEETSDAGASLPPAFSPELLGAIGVAATTLRPAGKARFGNDFVDVIAEGHYVEAGTRVQVVEIDGVRVVVKAV